MADKKSPKKKKRGFFSILLFLIFLTSLGGCGYLFYGEVEKELNIRDMEEDIQTFVTSPQPDVSSESENHTSTDHSLTFDWNGLDTESDYVIGWIQVPGIDRINYPIVQHPDDNQFFLTHDWKGAQQSAGAIFLNRYNAPDFTDMNSIIYGHRMKAGSMFGSLKYYEKQEFLDEHPCFNIYTSDGCKRTYEIVCCSHVTDGSDAYLLHFESPEERMAYYDMMIYHALSKRDVELNQFDTTVMLSTCNSSAGYYERVVILGKLASIDLQSDPETLE